MLSLTAAWWRELRRPLLPFAPLAILFASTAHGRGMQAGTRPSSRAVALARPGSRPRCRQWVHHQDRVADLLGGGLEQLDGIAVRILQLDLLTAWSGLHLIAEAQPRLLQDLNPSRKICHLQH
jgi:hypothetical protein